MKKSNKENEQKIAYYEEVTKRKWHKNATVLDCSFSLLTVLPALPPYLKILNCSCNRLEVLPELPRGLTELYCAYNRLEVLPALPRLLKNIDCYNNLLKVLPKLPSNLKIFYCYNNLLKVYIEIGNDKSYKYISKGFIAGKRKYVQMGCFLRLLKDWEKNFWNNDQEFPNDGSEKSNNRYKRFLKIKNYLDKY